MVLTPEYDNAKFIDIECDEDKIRKAIRRERQEILHDLLTEARIRRGGYLFPDEIAGIITARQVK